MLPGNIQYWRLEGAKGAKELDVDEPIHFAGPPPETQLNSSTAHSKTQQIEEEKKEEEPQITQPVKPLKQAKDYPFGPARHSPSEETKMPSNPVSKPI